MSAAGTLLRSVIGRHRRIGFYSISASAAAALCTLAVPGVMRAAVDGALHGNVQGPFVLAAGLAVLTATASAARYAGGALLGEAVAGDLLAVVTQHVRTLDAATFDRHPANDLLSQLTADTLLLQDSSVPAIMVACRNALLLSGALIGAFITAPKLLLLALLPPLALIPILKLLVRRSRDALSRLKQTDATVYSRLRELLDDLPGLQALRLDAAVHADLMRALEHAQAQRRARIQARAISVFVGIAGIFGGVTLVLYIGTAAAVAGTISGGTLTAFVLYVAFAAGAAGSLSEVRGEIQKASAALTRLSTVLQLQPQVRNPEQTLPLPRHIDPTVPAIEFRNVSFVYNIQRPTPVLNNVSFSIMPGEHVVLTGPSGGGKSSVFALLLRLRLPTSGSILIHGVPIDALDLDDLRNAMAYVPQAPRLRDGSAADAIAAPDEATLQRVLREADLSETIAALPQGVHTLLGENGGALSGGQRQRLTLARALARDASILLCDEATSAVDAASQARILAALRARNQTILSIAHGTDAAAEATRVLSLENGMIA